MPQDDKAEQPTVDLNEPFAGHFTPDTRLFQNWPGKKTFDGKPFGQGQCVACGFLGRRSLDRSHPAIEEVAVDDRTFGTYFFLVDGKTPSVPWCLVDAADLLREAQAHYDFTVKITKDAINPVPPMDIGETGVPPLPSQRVFDHRDAAASMVIAKDRKCPEWFPYREFQSPVEHRQERDMLQIEEMRRQQAADSKAVAEANLKVAEALKDIAQQTKDIHAESRETSTKTDAFMRKWTRAAVIVGVLALGAFLLSYLLPGLGPAIGHALAPGLQGTTVP